MRRALGIWTALLLCAPFCGGGLGEQVAAAAHTDRAGSGWASLSSANQGEISKAMGRVDAGYWVRPLAGVPTFTNAGQHFTAQFLPTGAEVATGDARWGLGLSAVGRGARLDPVPSAVPVTEVNRVSYRRGPVDEWYVNGPAGLEQGFTLGQRPAGDPVRPLTLALGAPGGLTGTVDRGGAGLVLTHGRDSLAYRGLDVRDATGRALRAHLDLRGGQVLVRVDDQGAQYPVTVDPFVQTAKLIASDGAANDGFGGAMAISGSTVVFGVSAVKVGANAAQGAAYVFAAPTGPGGTMTQVAKLTASDGAAGDRFGQALAVDGNTLVVGAPNAKVGTNTLQGAAYVFVQPAGGWSGTPTAPMHEAAKLTASDGATKDALGCSVGISGATVVAGADSVKVGGNPVQGTGYVFTQPAGGWAGTPTAPLHEAAKVTASDGAANDQFGFSVAISGTTVIFGAPKETVGANTHQGAGYVFVQPAGGWSGTPTAPMNQTAKLIASDGGSGDMLFSFNGAAISGNTVVAGAPQAKVGTNLSSGAAYVFVAPPGGWAGTPMEPLNESAKLTASDGGPGDKFGSAVGISGNVVVAGSPLAIIGANFSQGAVYAFPQPAGGWTGTAGETQSETAKLTAADGAPGDEFGEAVAISGNTLVAGAPQATVGTNTFQGAGYIFQAAPAATTTTLGVTPPSPAPAGPGETLTATITPTAAGTVQFMDGATPLVAPVTVTGGTASLTTTLAPGSHSLSAAFTPTDQNPVTGLTGSISTPVAYTVNAKRPLCIRICG